MGRSSDLKYLAGESELSHRSSSKRPPDKTPEESQLIARLLRMNPNLTKLAPLNEEQIQQLVRMAWKETTPKGAMLMTEGDLDNATFYIVKHGSFEVTASEPFEVVDLEGGSFVSRPERPPAPSGLWRQSDRSPSTPLARISSRSASGLSTCSAQRPQTVRRIFKNAMVGDSSMYYGTPRWTSAIAMMRSEVWVISQAAFKTVQFQALDAQPSAKTAEDEQLIVEVLQFNENLQRLTHLTERHLKELAGVAWRHVVEKDVTMMMEGDLNADALYIVGEGSLEFTGTEPFVQTAKGRASYLSRAAHVGQALDAHAGKWGKTLDTFGRGLCFGEVSMLYCAPRFSTVVAKERSVLWAIDRASFQMVQMRAAEDEIKDRVKHLNGLTMLESFSKEDKEKLAGAMETMRLTQGEALVSQDELGSTLYIMLKGSVVHQTEGQPERTVDSDSATGNVHYVGVTALMGNRQPSQESVKVASNTAVALVMEREEFHKIWDRLMEARPSPAFSRYSTSVTKHDVDDQKHLFALKSMKNIGLIACGALGPIQLCQHKSSKQHYVLKSMSKGIIVQKGLRKSIMKERMLWVGVVSPFITRVFAAYNEPQSLCFLVEPALGGELSRAYERHNLYGSEKHAKFYVAGVVLALEHLHKRRIVYRAVQPQNVLLDEHGHPKLSDMALAKLVAFGRTFTVCGTPTYMAPEILAGVGHTRAVDWWAVGVMAYELMSGCSPFESDHPMEVYSKVMRGFARLALPEACRDGPVGDLVGSLLQQDPIDRLPMHHGGIKNVFEHPWFGDFEWASMRSLTMEVPYEPSWQTPPSKWKDLTPSRIDMYLTHFRPATLTLPEPVEYRPGLAESQWDADFETVVEA